MSESKQVDVIVLGGGISGLTAAFLVNQGDLSVAVLERETDPGGAIRTWKKDGFIFELGPNTVLNNALEIDALCEVAGVMEARLKPTPESKRRYVVKGGKLVKLPGGPVGFLRTPLFSLRAKLRLLKEPFISRPPAGTEESIAEFTRRRLGQEFLDYAVGPFVSGVYAGDPARLSVKHATAKIHALEENYGGLIRGAMAKRKGPAPAGGLFSFEGGLETLPRTLAERIGGGWQPATEIHSVRKVGERYEIAASHDGEDVRWSARAVVSALPAVAASQTLAPLGGEFPGRIASLPYANVAVVCLGYRREQVSHPLDGFGFLAPAVENRHVLGCLFPSSLFEGRAPDGHVALAAFVGGAVHPERVSAEPDEILAAVCADLTELVGISGEPVISRVERWQPAIPQYVVGHGDHKEAARGFEEADPGVFLSGNILHGVSVADCIRNATGLAARVAEFLS